MARTRKITQNINKDSNFNDLPKVRVPHNKWETRSSNYITSNIGDIVPVFIDEVLPSEERKITMGMLSHMTTPIAPIFNAQYTEFRTFFVPYRLCCDLLGGYKTRKSPWVKVFGEDDSVSGASVVVPLANQKLPSVSTNLRSNVVSNLSTFGGVLDSLDYDGDVLKNNDSWKELNFMDVAAYELIYQYKYRNQNRETATESPLYKWCYNLYNRTSTTNASFQYCDSFHKANREKDYFTGSQPFTQKSNSPVVVGLVGEAPLKVSSTYTELGGPIKINNSDNDYDSTNDGVLCFDGTNSKIVLDSSALQGALMSQDDFDMINLKTDLTSAGGVDINSLRVMIKTQELLEKDMMYGSDYMNSLNAHFGTCPISLVIEEPLELKKVTITSQMQPIFQTSSTSGESTILGQIGANATTQSGEFEILPMTKFKEHGLIVICAVHKAQNSYDSLHYKPKRIFKKSRFDFYTPELDSLGYQPVSRLEFDVGNPVASVNEAVSFNEAFAEYRYKFNRVHGMFESSRTGALSYWTLSCSGYNDIQSLYKQTETELDRAISVSSATAPQFFDAYGFVETNIKPMSLHSIPGMDGVI